MKINLNVYYSLHYLSGVWEATDYKDFRFRLNTENEWDNGSSGLYNDVFWITRNCFFFFFLGFCVCGDVCVCVCVCVCALSAW